MSYNIEFSDKDYRVKTLDSKDEFELNYKLRYQVFCDKLNWIPPRKDKRDKDRYDDWSTTIGVFDNENRLVGSLRIICSKLPMMIEYEFKNLVPSNYKIEKRQDIVELTRMTVTPEADNRQKGIISHCIYKGIYLWCLLNDVRYSYAVVEKRIFRVARLGGLPFTPIGPMIELDVGVPSLAAIIDWRVFEEKTPNNSDFFQFNRLSIPPQIENEVMGTMML